MTTPPQKFERSRFYWCLIHKKFVLSHFNWAGRANLPTHPSLTPCRESHYACPRVTVVHTQHAPVWFCLCLSFLLCVSPCLCLCLSLRLRRWICLHVCLGFSLSLLNSLRVFLCLCLPFWHGLCVCVCLFFVSFWLHLFRTFAMFFSLCVSAKVWH